MVKNSKNMFENNFKVIDMPLICFSESWFSIIARSSKSQNYFFIKIV